MTYVEKVLIIGLLAEIYLDETSYNRWVLLGYWLGYPLCCIRAFGRGEHQNIAVPHINSAWEVQYMRAGFCPCPEHAAMFFEDDNLVVEDILCETRMEDYPSRVRGLEAKIREHWL